MYKLTNQKLPKGYTMSEYINEQIANAKTDEEIEQCKETLFRLIYPMGYREVQKYSNIVSLEEGLTDMSVAFIRTFNNYDPTKEGSSFPQYFKLTIKSEIINNTYGRYRVSDESRELWYAATRNMDYLDEPVMNKDEKETGTKANALADEKFDIERHLMDEDFKNDVHKVIDSMFAKAGRHKPSTEDIFKCYIDSLMTSEPLNYTQVAKKFGKSGTNVRKICIEYAEKFKKEWEERQYVR